MGTSSQPGATAVTFRVTQQSGASPWFNLIPFTEVIVFYPQTLTGLLGQAGSL